MSVREAKTKADTRRNDADEVRRHIADSFDRWAADGLRERMERVAAERQTKTKPPK